ncbi:unnamed protein product, partial [marine sediment metagenome]
KVNNNKLMKQTFSKRGIEEIISEKSLEDKLKSGKKLRIKLGVDPSSPDIHLGHAVVLRVLKQFQEMGHTVIFLLGDYTAMVGDPSGKNKTRPVLTAEEIEKNAKTYLDQVGKVLDIDKVVVRKNSEWYKKESFRDILKLTSAFTFASIIERDDFSKRIRNNQEVSMNELLYPMMQAYDSVKLKADVELGGTDQKFNMLAGRSLQKKSEQVPQEVVMSKLLVGTDGKEKMSKSLGNYIGVTDEARDMFGKVMSINDEMIEDYFLLCTDLSEEDIKKNMEEMKTGKNPRDVKAQLAKEIVSIYHSKDEAEDAEKEFVNQFSKGNEPEDKIEISSKDIEDQVKLVDLMVESMKATDSKSGARRLIEQGAVTVGGEKITDINYIVDAHPANVIKVGRRYWIIK